MHVLVVPSDRYLPADSPLEGIFQRDQAEALHRAGHRVGVVAPELRSLRLLRRQVRGWPHGIEETEAHGIPVLRLHGWYVIPRTIPHLFVPLVLGSGLLLYRRYVARHGRPDVIHAHGVQWAGLVAAAIRWLAGVPFVVTEHRSAFARGLIRPAELAWHRPILRAASARLVVSPGLGAALEAAVGPAARPWRVVPNVLEARFESPGLAPRVAAPRAPGLRLLSVASLQPVKGHADLLRALAGRFQGHADVTLRIAGEGPERERLGALARELGVAPQVTFLGQLTRAAVLEELLAASALVHPSRFETFGVVVIEALACGRPVVATRCGGPEHLVTPADGTLVPVGDVPALGAALVALRERLAAFDPHDLRARCLARYGEAALVTALEQVYREVA
jgi:glycosyltransferase involved in cell wall biosynthesis